MIKLGHTLVYSLLETLLYKGYNMDVKDTIANTTTMGGIFAYLMNFQGELTVLLLVTGLLLNITRLVDWFRGKKKD